MIAESARLRWAHTRSMGRGTAAGGCRTTSWSETGRFGHATIATPQRVRQLPAVPFTYEYHRPAVTVDTVLATISDRGKLRVLLIERGNDPFAGHWALPGGFVDQHEDLMIAARREMMEETHIELGPLVQLGAYGTPHRDPRGHTVGVAFLAMVEPDAVVGVAGDDAVDCRWFAAARPPKLAFDHGAILRDARTMFARIAANKQDFQRTFFARRRPASLERLRRAARGTR